jgi:hypothetical protein
MLSNRIHNLAPPPRPVPLPIICSTMLGITGSFGVIFLISGLVGTLVFTHGIRPIDEFRLARTRAIARGMVTGVYETNATENEVDVYEYRFAFTAQNEKEYTGTSYTTGRQLSVESAVTIEYVPGDPSIARIQGARISTFTPWVLFVLIFPAVGGAMFISAAIGGWRQVMLLRHGKIADARILTTHSTRMEVNDTPVLEYSYEIRTSMGEVFEGKSRSMPSDRIGDEEVEPALYLPENPGRSILVDAIPLRYALDVDGLSGQWISLEGNTKVVLYVLAWMVILLLTAFAFLNALGVIR